MKYFLIILSCLFVTINTAEAKKYRHYHHYKKIAVTVQPQFCFIICPIEQPKPKRIFRNKKQKVYVAKKSITPQSSSFVSSSVVTIARSQLGSGPIYGRSNLWCARFMNYVLSQAGYNPTGSDVAKSFLGKPRVAMAVGTIAVMGRRRGGHVGVVSGIDARGNPIIISGNAGGNRVREWAYPRSRIIAFVQP